MKENKSRSKTYKVTGSVYVEACSVRHAAHKGKGVFQMKDGGPYLFTVEERCVSLKNQASVDLSKSKGQKGYVEDVCVEEEPQF